MGPLDDLVNASDPVMVVVTVAGPAGLFGCLVGFHAQVSIEPLRYAVCLSHANATYPVALAADELAVHLLGASQLDLASLFGEHSADDGVDKFERCSWQRLGGGPPVLDGVLAWFVGTVVESVPVGDHSAFVLEPRQHGTGLTEAPLRYHATRDFTAGH